MVYSQPEINFSAQVANPPNRAVYVTYNGTGIHEITGPVPLVDINQNISRNGAGLIEGYTTTVNLTGKIVRTGVDGEVLPSGSGIGPVITAINQLRSFFKQNDHGVLEIICNVTNKLFSATGVRLVDLSFNNTSDNWIFTADYTASFEFYEPSGISDGFYVKSTNDSWSIEPIEDALYENFNLLANTKGEIHNPNLRPTAPAPNNPIPGAYGGSGPITPTQLSVYNIPQYRVSHRVSAVGVPRVTGTNAPYSAYMEAKRWAENRLSTAFYQNPQISGLAYVLTNPTNANPTLPSVFQGSNTYLYNHLRSINFSVSEGSYEVNDTWLAMPTGIQYLEDYSVEASTDEKYVKTVRVQGQIRGLYMSTFPYQSGSSDFNPPSGLGLVSLNGYDQRLAGSLGQKNIPDNLSQTSVFNTINQYKYHNAASGWIYDIKPYLYRRAGIVINSLDRNKDANPKVLTDPPNNPMFSSERLLNPNPVSTTEGHDPRKGTINYSVEYNNKLMLIPGVISENISINQTGPTDVFSESFVIGRRLGPILQSLNAKTSTKKDISIDIVVIPPSSLKGMMINMPECPVYISGAVYRSIEAIVEALRPFGEVAEISNPPLTLSTPLFGGFTKAPKPGQVFLSQDNHNWNPAEGRFSRNVSWVYQQCNNFTFYLDH